MNLKKQSLQDNLNLERTRESSVPSAKNVLTLNYNLSSLTFIDENKSHNQYQIIIRVEGSNMRGTIDVNESNLSKEASLYNLDLEVYHHWRVGW